MNFQGVLLGVFLGHSMMPQKVSKDHNASEGSRRVPWGFMVFQGVLEGFMGVQREFQEVSGAFHGGTIC